MVLDTLTKALKATLKSGFTQRWWEGGLGGLGWWDIVQYTSQTWHSLLFPENSCGHLKQIKRNNFSLALILIISNYITPIFQSFRIAFLIRQQCKVMLLSFSLKLGGILDSLLSPPPYLLSRTMCLLILYLPNFSSSSFSSSIQDVITWGPCTQRLFTPNHPRYGAQLILLNSIFVARLTFLLSSLLWLPISTWI